MSLDESVETICGALEDAVERTCVSEAALSLTGGHDSRLIAASLAYVNRPFRCLAWKDGNFNDYIVHKIAHELGKDIVTVSTHSQKSETKKEVFEDSDGQYIYIYGFPAVGRACRDLGIGLLYTGYAGDMLSGSLTVPEPERLGSTRRLASEVLREQIELMSFDEAEAHLGVSRDETLSEWFNSFQDFDTLSDTCIWQRLRNRNFKRIRFAMTPASRYVQLIFPYADSRVLDAYFRLPLKYLKLQKAHCYAGFHRYPGLGKFQATSYPIPLKLEAACPRLLYGARLIRRYCDWRSDSFRRMRIERKLVTVKHFKAHFGPVGEGCHREG